MSEWTAGKFRTFITGVLRSGFRKYPSKYETLKEASVGKKLNQKTKRIAEHFKCAECKQDYPAKEVNVDHVNPVVCPVEGFVNWDVYIKRMFCGKENLQVLCKTCHDLKSAEERKVRKENNGDNK
jgi:5-methylcytosine-specific restriction endonuclease McrA